MNSEDEYYSDSLSEFGSSDEENEKVNFDITTVIVMISDITNDNNNAVDALGDKSKWKNANYKIYEQISNEMKDPLLPKLNNILEGMEWVMVKSAYQRLEEIVCELGNISEKKRHEIFCQKVTVIDDDPSDTFIKLKNIRIWSTININIFGTSDKYNYFTTTANLRIASHLKDMKNKKQIFFDIQPHRSRSLIGSICQ